MDPRRILLAFAIFLLISAMLSSLGNGTRRAERAEKPPTRQVLEQPREIEGRLPRDKVVRARPGDLVKVTVTNAEFDTAEIVGLGLRTQVAQGYEGELEFLAGAPGTYPVTLRISQRPIGRVVVLEALSAAK